MKTNQRQLFNNDDDLHVLRTSAGHLYLAFIDIHGNTSTQIIATGLQPTLLSAMTECLVAYNSLYDTLPDIGLPWLDDLQWTRCGRDRTPHMSLKIGDYYTYTLLPPNTDPKTLSTLYYIVRPVQR